MEVLLETRLGELSSDTNPEDLAKGAEALQLLLGQAAVTQVGDAVPRTPAPSVHS